MTGHIVYRLAPHPTKPNKTLKIPLSVATMAAANPLDPVNWMPLAEATSLAAAFGAGYGVGMVFETADPYWFLDLDECLVGGTWSQTATEMCAALAGAYIEVSQSGRGLHLIGRGTLPPHGKEVTGLGGLYHDKRYCALTGINASGSMDTDLQDAIGAIALKYFPVGTGSDGDLGEWTDGPCEGWNGPIDDDDLIRIARRSVSAGTAFGGKVSFAALFSAEEAALSKRWPQSDRPYDISAADAALAYQLAFWTGNDCVRIERLMRESALSRDKWERDSYLRTTILKMCKAQKTVATGRPAAAPADGVVAEAGVSEVSAPFGGFKNACDLADHFKGCVYIENRYVVAVPDGSLLGSQQFRSNGRYGGYRFSLDSDSKTTRNAWDALLEGELYRAPFANALCFRPELPSRSLVMDAGRVLFNSYVPIKTPSTPGDAGPFVRHMEKLLPDETDRMSLFSYMAAVIQNPGAKMQWAPVLQGVVGNGKTLCIEVMIQAIGERYCHLPKTDDLGNKFTGWLEGKLFVGLEEIYIQGQRELLDTLKVLIANRRIEIQGKGHDQVMGDNRANFFLCTNHKDAIPKTNDDRRYGIYFTAQQSAEDLARDGMNGSYFPKLYGWLQSGGYAIVTDYLQTFAIPAEMDPTGDAHRAPITTSTQEAIVASLGVIEQNIMEAIASDGVGFRGGWISSTHLGLLLDARKLSGRCPHNMWDMMLRTLGYIKHPQLSNGRVNNGIPIDGGRKSRLWVREGSIQALNLRSPSEAVSAYVAAQSAPISVGVAA